MEIKNIQTNHVYKDSLFKRIFGREEHKDWLLSLYNAVNNSNCTEEDILEITTIDNIIYLNMKNDVSFLIDSQMNLYEHQSTSNPNMPLRGLFYFSNLYQAYLTKMDLNIFSSKLLKIPTPQFIVFYNGISEQPDKSYLKLSDAFMHPLSEAQKTDFEWTATMLNINKGHNSELMEKCRALREYSLFVGRVQNNLLKGLTKIDAVNEAVEYASRENFLDGLFKRERSEVLQVSLTEFDMEEYGRHQYRDGHEDGISEGREAQRKEDEAIITAQKEELSIKDAELSELKKLLSQHGIQLPETHN